MQRPFCVGITGGIGAGKSQVSRAFAARGVQVIDTDVIAVDLVTPGAPAWRAIRALFGDAMLLPDRQLDRRKLRERIFTDPAAKAALESILHPAIRSEVEHRLQTIHTISYTVLVIPLLVENHAHYAPLIDRVLVIDCAPQTQIARCQQRDGINAELAARIVAAQASRQARLAIADDILDNEGPLGALGAQVDALHASYLKLAKRSR